MLGIHCKAGPRHAAVRLGGPAQSSSRSEHSGLQRQWGVDRYKSCSQTHLWPSQLLKRRARVEPADLMMMMICISNPLSGEVHKFNMRQKEAVRELGG